MKTDESGVPSEQAKFRINSSYQEFTNRQKSLFDQLNLAEHSTRNLLPSSNAFMDVDDRTSPIEDINENPRSEIKMKQFQGKESIFKKPQARPPRGMTNRKVPDYQKNPHKWTRYSLDDVKSEDMSDRANTAAAMSFLKEIKMRKTQSEESMDSGDMPHKITFKKAMRRMNNERIVKESPPTATIFQNSKVVMPEYVVGQKIKKEQRRKEKKIGGSISAKEIKLGHLLEDDEDGEDN